MRWLWIDRFLEFHRGKSARAVKNLSLAEEVFAEHFPGYPVMPAALILEGLAQTGGILVGEANNFQEKVVLAKIVSAKFAREALAGETLVYDVEILNLRPEGASIRGRVFAGAAGAVASPGPGAQPIGEAEIFFAHLDKTRSQQIFGDHNFVFSGELQHVMGLAKLLADRAESAERASANVDKVNG
jgi:3-hydroxyacyl-[acyl-carrier-protein] dehydratase